MTAPSGASDDDLAKQNIFFAILSLDLSEGQLVPMGFDPPELRRPGEEARLRATVRAAAERAGEGVPTDLREALVRHLAIVTDELRRAFGDDFTDRLLAFGREIMRHPAQDPQAFLWAQLIKRNFSTRTPPALAQTVRAELARQEVVPTPTVPGSAWDRAQVAALGYPVNPDTEGRMESTPMSHVVTRVAHVAFVRAWDRALAASKRPEEEIDALFDWGKKEARTFDLPPELVKRPGGWVSIPETS